MKIFLSHRSRDKATVREFKQGLPEFLLSWLDEHSLCWGDGIHKSIKDAIDSEVDYVIFFSSSDALASGWVRDELDWAFKREEELGRKFVLPIILDDPSALPTTLTDRLFLRLRDFAGVSIRELARLASDQLFQLLVRSSPKSELRWSRHVLHLPLAMKHTRKIRGALSDAIDAASAALTALRRQGTEKPLPAPEPRKADTRGRKAQGAEKPLPAPEEVLDKPPTPRLRANIFLPETNHIDKGDVCTLTIPKTRDEPEEWLQLNMEKTDELEIRFRPGVGATGRVFVDQCAVGAIATGKTDRKWEFVPLHPEDVVSSFVMPKQLDIKVHEDFGWLISMPIIRRMRTRGETIGVFNVDCLNCRLTADQLKQLFPVVAPYAGVIAGILKQAPLGRVAISKFSE
jgi:hypothetical protein